MICFDDVSKRYYGPGGRVDVIANLSFKVSAGEMAVICGPSGCGKSTLLFMAGAMLAPTEGSVTCEQHDIYSRTSGWRNRFRRTSVGFIFQRFHLIPYLNAEQNILWSLRWSADSAKSARRLPELARTLGIAHILAHYPHQLSAGEQQRVAAARAILGEKKIICADEPTGNLDEQNASLVMEAIRNEAQRGSTVLLATHDSDMFDMGHTRIDLRHRERYGAEVEMATASGF